MCSLQLLPRLIFMLCLGASSDLLSGSETTKPCLRTPKAGESLGQNSDPNQNKQKTDIISVLQDWTWS